MPEAGRNRKSGSGEETDRQVLAEAHARALERVRILEKVLHLFSAPQRLEQNLLAVLDMAMEAIPAEAGSILLLDESEENLLFAAARGPVAGEIKGLTVPVGEGLVGACMQDKRSFPVSDVSREPRFSRKISEQLGFPTQSILAVPIVFRGAACGAIEVINRKGSSTFLAHEVNLVEKLAQACGALVSMGVHLAAH